MFLYLINFISEIWTLISITLYISVKGLGSCWSNSGLLQFILDRYWLLSSLTDTRRAWPGVVYVRDNPEFCYGAVHIPPSDSPYHLPESFALILWYHVWVYMYPKVSTTHFYHLALCNLVLCLTNILLKSKLFKWWMTHSDMTVYHHATIIEYC